MGLHLGLAALSSLVEYILIESEDVMSDSRRNSNFESLIRNEPHELQELARTAFYADYLPKVSPKGFSGREIDRVLGLVESFEQHLIRQD